MSGLHNFTWPQGEDLVISLVYKEGPEGEELPVDLTDYELRMDIAIPTGDRRYTLNSHEDESDPDSDPEVELGEDGQIYIRVPREATLKDGELYDDITGQRPILAFIYDIFLRDTSSEHFNNGRQFRILKGQVSIDRSVTLWK